MNYKNYMQLPSDVKKKNIPRSFVEYFHAFK